MTGNSITCSNGLPRRQSSDSPVNLLCAEEYTAVIRGAFSGGCQKCRFRRGRIRSGRDFFVLTRVYSSPRNRSLATGLFSGSPVEGIRKFSSDVRTHGLLVGDRSSSRVVALGRPRLSEASEKKKHRQIIVTKGSKSKYSILIVAKASKVRVISIVAENRDSFVVSAS